MMQFIFVYLDLAWVCISIIYQNNINQKLMFNIKVQYYFDFDLLVRYY